MRLFALELKRLLRSRMTVILLGLSLLLSFVMAYLPVTFSYVSVPNEQGELVPLLGMDAVKHQKQIQQSTAGEVTPQKVRRAVETYQACLKRYGVEYSYELPDEVYAAEILPIAPLLHGVREAFADPDTGIAPAFSEIDPARIDDYYGVCQARLEALMAMEQKDHPQAQAAAREIYSRVETPYQLYPGYTTDALDYQLLLAFLIVLFCTVIAAPVFSSDYQTGADEIQRCTRNGRLKFAMVKLVSALLVSAGAFCLCLGVYLLVSNSLYGWECTKTSMQMLYSIVNLPNLNLGGLQLSLAGAALLSLLCSVSLALLLSSLCRSVVAAVSVSLLSCFLPVLLYMALPEAVGQWICPILPASGVALQTSFLYALADFTFWNLGSVSLWTPQAMLAACLVETPLFFGLTLWTYCRKR